MAVVGAGCSPASMMAITCGCRITIVPNVRPKEKSLASGGCGDRWRNGEWGLSQGMVNRPAKVTRAEILLEYRQHVGRGDLAVPAGMMTFEECVT